jgi:hypothetical protein
MGSDLIAWIVAGTLGVVVVGLGLRRDLGDATRDWLPRPGEASGREATMLRSPEGAQQRRRPLSPQQRRWIVRGYVLMSLGNAALAVVWANDRWFHGVIAVLFALSALAFWLKKWPPPVEGSVS